MPIWLRNFTYNEINDFYLKEKEEFDKSLGKEKVTANTDINKLKAVLSKNVQVPSYVTSAKKPKK